MGSRYIEVLERTVDTYYEKDVDGRESGILTKRYDGRHG